MYIYIYIYNSAIWMHHMDTDDGDCIRMLQVILNKSWKQHPIKL